MGILRRWRLTRIREHGIGDGDESSDEIRRHSHTERPPLCRIDTGSDHPHHARDYDADHTSDTEPSETVQSARQSTEQGRDREDASIQHQAQLTVRKGGQGDLAGEQLTAGSKHGEDDGPETEQFPAEPAEEDESCVSHVVNYQPGM